MERAGTVVVIGGGPSLTPDDVEYCRGKAKVIAIKEAVTLAPWADVLYFCDWYWYEANRIIAEAFRGLVATIEDAPGKLGTSKQALKQTRPELRIYRHDGVDGLTDDAAALRTGHNSGYQAIHIAYHLGAKTIVLLGLDMKANQNGRMHWFPRRQEYPAQMYQELMLPKFPALAAALAARGVRVVNASPDSAIECFEKRPLREVL